MTELADVRPLEGHVYVVSFESGMIKVGHAVNPSTRLRTYVKDGHLHGNPVAETWVSPPHGGSWDNETRLIRFCAQRGRIAGQHKRGEYFTDIPFETVRDFAQGLDFPRTDREHHERQQKEAIKELSRRAGLDRMYKLPPRVTELADASTETERDALAALWASAVGVGVAELETIRPKFDERLRQFMLDAQNLRRDAEYFRDLAERVQAEFEAHTTQTWADISAEIQQALREGLGEPE